MPPKRPVAAAAAAHVVPSIITHRVLVSGKVQGVFYRKYTQRKAAQLGVTGFVRNLPDGRVEIVAEGTAEQVRALEAWCHEGPPKSEVTAVSVTDCTGRESEGGDGGTLAGPAPPPLTRRMKEFIVTL